MSKSISRTGQAHAEQGGIDFASNYVCFCRHQMWKTEPGHLSNASGNSAEGSSKPSPTWCASWSQRKHFYNDIVFNYSSQPWPHQEWPFRPIICYMSVDSPVHNNKYVFSIIDNSQNKKAYHLVLPPGVECDTVAQCCVSLALRRSIADCLCSKRAGVTICDTRPRQCRKYRYIPKCLFSL